MNECKSDDEAKNREKVFWFCWLKSSSFHINFMALFFFEAMDHLIEQEGAEKNRPRQPNALLTNFFISSLMDFHPKKSFSCFVFFFLINFNTKFPRMDSKAKQRKTGKTLRNAEGHLLSSVTQGCPF